MMMLLRSAPLALAAILATPGSAPAQESLNLDCDGTMLVLTCQTGADTGNCRTASASDSSFDVTCTAHSLGGNTFRMICRNATDIGGAHVELTFQGNRSQSEVAKGAGTATGTNCSVTD